MSNHFSGWTMQRYVFFLTMQRSMMNIISSKVNNLLKPSMKSYSYLKKKLHYFPVQILKRLHPFINPCHGLSDS